MQTINSVLPIHSEPKSSSLYPPPCLAALVLAHPALNPPEIGFSPFPSNRLLILSLLSLNLVALECMVGLYAPSPIPLTPFPSLPLQLPLVSQLKPLL